MGNARQLIGQTFGDLFVESRSENNRRGEANWICRCHCGKHHIVNSNRLTAGIVKSCGCRSRGVPRDDSVIGVTFNGLEITGVVSRDIHREWIYKYKCLCGGTGTIRRSNIGKNKTCPNCRWGDYGGVRKGHWSRIENNAISRGIALLITHKDVWELFIRQNGICALSGVKLSLARGHTGNQTASLDRIDGTKPYTLDNVQWVHKVINEMKMDRTDKEFIKWCERVAGHNHEQSDCRGV